VWKVYLLIRNFIGMYVHVLQNEAGVTSFKQDSFDMTYFIYILCHMLHSILSAHVSSASQSSIDSVAMSTLQKEKKNDWFLCTLFQPVSSVSKASSGPVPEVYWIIPHSFRIAHASSWITETITVRKFLWWGTQQRGRRAHVCIPTAVATS
jgi:hypothetical protein